MPLVLALRCSAAVDSGSVDASFSLAAPPDAPVRSMVFSTDGSIILAGDFQHMGGMARGRIARVLADGSFDVGFATGSGANGPIRQVILASGNIIIAGDFTTYDGVTCGRIARLLPNGTLDSTFTANGGANGPIHALLLAPFANLIVGGEFTTFGGVARRNFAQISLAGVVSSWDPSPDGPVFALMQHQTSNTSTFVGGDFQTIAGITRPRFALVSSFGSPISSFMPPAPNAAVRAIAPTKQNAPAYIIGGDFTALGATPVGRLAFLGSDGALMSPDFFSAQTDLAANGAVLALRQESLDVFAGLIVGGAFSQLGGKAGNALARVKGAAPFVDSAFNSRSGPNGSVFAARVDSGKRVYIGGEFTEVDGAARPYFARVHGLHGSQPPSPPANVVAEVISDSRVYLTWSPFEGAAGYWTPAEDAAGFRIQRSSDGGASWAPIATATVNDFGFYLPFTDAGLTAATTYRYRVIAYNVNGDSLPSNTSTVTTRAAPWTGAGSVDPAIVGVPAPITSSGASVLSVLSDPGGRIVIGGDFKVNGSPLYSSIARLNPDWSIDSSFAVGSGPNNRVRGIARFRDGRYLLVGDFSDYAGVARSGIARVHPNGILDLNFDVGQEPNGWMAGNLIDQLGRPIVHGSFTTFGSVERRRVARLKPDGTLDSSFTGESTVAGNNAVEDVAELPDGKLLFTKLGNGDWKGFCRASPDGVLDPSYGNTEGALSSCIAVLPDGRAYVGGRFVSFFGVPKRSVARILPDGTVDPTFDCGSNSPADVVLPLPNGKVVVGGNFIRAGGSLAFNLARLNADGTRDLTFDVESGPGGQVSCLALQEDGKIIVGGNFSTFNGFASPGIARLRGDPPFTAPPPPPATLTTASVSSSLIRLTWSVVENATRYQVEVSDLPNGGWTVLDSTDWTAITLLDRDLEPGTTRYYRVAARHSGGQSAFSNVVSNRTLTRFEEWNVEHGFSAAEEPGTDSDGDGLPHLFEFALGRDPSMPDAAGAITTRIVGGYLEVFFQKARPDVVCAVEASADLRNWTTDGVEVTGDPLVTGRIPLTGQNSFLRVRVTSP